jgi:hypothetical protein
MPKPYEQQMIELLYAEVESARSEADALRTSIRYRLGDVLLQAQPFSWRSILVLPRLYAVYRTYRRNLYVKSITSVRAAPGQPFIAQGCPSVLFARSPVDIAKDIYVTNDSAAVVARLDAAPLQQLVLRAITEPIARRLGRLQLQGCEIIWWPEAPESDNPFEVYVRSMASECRYGAFP